MHSRRVRWRSSLRWALLAVGAVALALAAVELAMLAASPVGPHWVIMMIPATGLVSLGTGLVAWDRRPSNRLGVLLVGTGVAWLAAGLANTSLPLTVAIGQVTATLPLALTIHALLAFPEGRVTGRRARAVVIAAYVVALVLQAPLYLFASDEPPFDVLSVAENPELLGAAEVVQRAAGTAVILAATWLLVRRAVEATPVQRRTLVPVAVYGILAVLFAILSGNLLEPILGLDPIARISMQLLILAGVPVAFVVGLLFGPFGRAGEVAELAVWLGDEDRHGWTSALAEALGDPTVRLLFWLPDRGAYVDISGQPSEPPEPGSGRAFSPIALADRTVGALDYDPLLNPDPALIAEAGDLIALAIDRQRLTVELRESRQSLRASRTRLVEATDRERRRIALDLHDGVQATLLGLALQAGMLNRDLVDGRGGVGAARAASGSAGQLEAGIVRCAAVLRDLVHGIMPSLLIERGLFAATEELVDSLPATAVVVFHGDDRGLPAAIESTAYFVISEALANAAKHARASALSVVVRRDDGRLWIQVSDDGIGGVRPDGVGMHSMADRVDVVGGTLTVDSVSGRGTSLVAELPCGS